MRGVVAAIVMSAILISGTVAGAAYWMDQRAADREAQREENVVEAIAQVSDDITWELAQLDKVPAFGAEYSATPSYGLGVQVRTMAAVEAVAEAMTTPVPPYQDW